MRKGSNPLSPKGLLPKAPANPPSLTYLHPDNIARWKIAGPLDEHTPDVCRSEIGTSIFNDNCVWSGPHKTDENEFDCRCYVKEFDTYEKCERNNPESRNILMNSKDSRWWYFATVILELLWFGVLLLWLS